MHKTKWKWSRTKVTMLFTAVVLAIALVMSSVAAYAAGQLNTQNCTMTITLATEGETTFPYTADLAESDIEIRLYEVAALQDDDESYKATDNFKDLDVSDPTDTATITEQAAAMAADLTADYDLILNPSEGEGYAIRRDLEPGLYLVWPQQVTTAEYIYDFSPMVVSLPYQDETGAWNNALNLQLTKASRDTVKGSLTIDKTLTGYNAQNGNAMFVFSIEGEKIAADTGEPIIYSNVAALNFDGTGTKTLTLDDIPVGMEVTVTEVYTGGAYQTASAEAQTVTIGAEEAQTVSFTNDYNGGRIYENGVVNHFTAEEKGFTWSQLQDNSQEAN